MLGFFGGLFEFIRDLAILAAAVGVAKWAWDEHVEAPRRRDEEARARMAAERERAAAAEWRGKMQAMALDFVARQEEIVDRQRDREARMAQKVRLHGVLQASKEPYLTFAELKSTTMGHPAANGGATLFDGVDEDGFRRLLIELVAEGVVAQMEGDRYFIASDFDTDED